MFQRLIATTATWVTIPLRLALGVAFIGHGAQKVFGAFGGPGWARWTGGGLMPPPFGFMRPVWLWMGAAALGELLGGVLVLTGLLTRVGAFLIACSMLTAVLGVHWGAFFLPRGMEYALMALLVCVALLISGGGRASLDQALQDPRARRR
jgi:putative oxidoreductase